MNEKLKKKQKLEELGEIIHNAAKTNELACFLNLTDEQIWANVAKKLAEELLQIHSLEPSVEEMRGILNQIYIARNITMSEESILDALKKIDSLLRDPNSYN